MASGLAVMVDGEFDAELSGASRFEVYERMGAPTRFALRWPLVSSEGDLPLATDTRIAPGANLSLHYQESDGVHVLVKGPVTGHTLHLDHGGADAWIEAVGSDTSIEMDREIRSQVWADGTDADAVSAICGHHGLTGDIEATDGVHATDKHALVQRDSDLRFVQRLARRNGFLFWVTHDPTGAGTAHFKPPPLDATAPGRLVINQTPPTIHTFDLRFDVERPTGIDGSQLDLNTKAVIEASSATSPLALLGARDLLSITGDTRTVHVSAPVDDAGDLGARAAATLIDAGWFVHASCETNRAAFGGVLRAHSVVEVLGAGRRHSGRYFVAAVRHMVDSTIHKMAAELVRNAWEA
ncbi:MAG TPA: contractile injection system protein, VgrG/Pvc8 family [Kofleriaceae bacterium]|nr:contractile injection system protein, VgrG/Pvc8 family [Kofleriaceae bacterium]